MRKITFILFLMSAFFMKGKAQDEASVIWPLISTTQLEVSIGGQLEDAEVSFTGVYARDYTGPDGTLRVSPNDNAWAMEEDPDVFIEFSVTPKEGAIFTAKEISFYVCGNGGGKTRANFYYSTDPNFTNRIQIETYIDEDLEKDVFSQVTATINEVIEAGERLYLRIYPYYYHETANTGKQICIKDVEFSGTTEETEVAANVVWPFITNLNPVISGSLLAEPMAYSSNTRQYGWDARVRLTDGGEIVNNGTFCTNTDNCYWEASTEPIADIYVEYAVSPKTGATFTITDISLMIAATGTSSMVTAVWGSKDDSFGEYTILKENTDLINEVLQTWEISLSTPVVIETGETYYLRIYPFHKTEATYKLVAVRNVTINGSLIGATYDTPEVSNTENATYISTNSVITGGNISNDGGATVTERGIAYGISTAPTIEDNKQASESGTGLFSTTLTNLTAGTTYYARAYATNVAGTAYGPEITFKTLSELSVPTVSTSSTGGVMNTSFTVSGNVTQWGGTAVTEKGFVWGTTQNPTIESGNKIPVGEDLGSFQASVTDLTPETTYYVAAYAINETGVAYGNVLTVKTQATEPDVTKIIAQDGSGDYTTVTDAFNDVPNNYTGRWILRIKPGTYYERPTLAANKVNVYLVGENAETTIITHDTYSGQPIEEGGTATWGTSNCQTMAIMANDFTAIHITVQNTYVNSKANEAINSGTQAVALKTQGDRQAFYYCRITGYQDTYLGNSIGRAYFKDCYIEGNVDFIFGRQTAVFDQCITYVNREGSVLTAPSTEKTTAFGMVFLDCQLTAPSTSYVDFNGNTCSSFYLGRPWQQQPRSAFIRCEVPATLAAIGWTTMTGGLDPVFVEYGSTGAGATPTRLAARGNGGKVISETEAAVYTVENVFKKETDPSFTTDWMPQATPDEDLLPTGIGSIINNSNLNSYMAPNPFTDSAVINYTLVRSSKVKLTITDVNGSMVYETKENQAAGENSITFNASHLPTGIYFYTLQTDNTVETKKIIKK